MRVVGIDLGKARIGVAVAETEPFVVSPRPALAATGTLARDADAVSVLARREEAGTVVVGLPLEDGVEGRMARVMRLFGGLLTERGLVVAYADETLTSVAAQSSLSEAGLKGSQVRRAKDSEAACLILERWRNDLGA